MSTVGKRDAQTHPIIGAIRRWAHMCLAGRKSVGRVSSSKRLSAADKNLIRIQSVSLGLNIGLFDLRVALIQGGKNRQRGAEKAVVLG